MCCLYTLPSSADHWLVVSAACMRKFFSRHLCINDFKGPRQKFPFSWTTLHLGSTMEIILTHVSSLIPCFHVLLAGNSDTSAVSKTSIKTEWKWFLLAWNPCAILATTTGLSMVNLSRWACTSLRKGVLRLQSLWKACMCVWSHSTFPWNYLTEY